MNRTKQQKCHKYFKEMIFSEWKINERIPPVRDISNSLFVSKTLVYNTIRNFEKMGILKNIGRNQTFLIRKNNEFYINLLNTYVEIAGSDEVIYSFPWTIVLNNNKIIGINSINNVKITTTLDIVKSVKDNITLLQLLDIKDKDIFASSRKKYLKLEKIRPIYKVMYKAGKICTKKYINSFQRIPESPDYITGPFEIIAVSDHEFQLIS